MSEQDRPHSESYIEHEDSLEFVDADGLEALEPDSLLDQEALELLRNQLLERGMDLLRHHPGATITSSEYAETMTGVLALDRGPYQALFTQFHLEPYSRVVLAVQEHDGLPSVALEAIEPNNTTHSIGVGSEQELEVETVNIESGETMDHQPMVADAMFMQDILGIFEATLPMKSDHQDSSQS